MVMITQGERERVYGVGGGNAGSGRETILHIQNFVGAANHKAKPHSQTPQTVGILYKP